MMRKSKTTKSGAPLELQRKSPFSPGLCGSGYANDNAVSVVFSFSRINQAANHSNE